jgi:hypothetical protein
MQSSSSFKRILDPKNERIKANFDFYSNTLKGATKRLSGDDENQDSRKFLYNPYEFKNPRPEHVLGVERENYEALCRGEELKVVQSIRVILKILFKLIHFLYNSGSNCTIKQIEM